MPDRTVIVLRGEHVNPWELRAWERLGPGYRVRVLLPRRNRFEPPGGLEAVPVTTLGDLLPPGAAGRMLVRVPGQRYLGLAGRLEGADVVHAAELGYWFTWQAARLRARLGFKLVVTVWETLPFRDAYRNVRTRRYRADVLAAADLYLATTERARDALLLEGADPERIVVAPPGVDVERFGAARDGAVRDDPPLVVSIGRLVWEKGHQDLLRALALLRRERPALAVRALIVGTGPEEGRLRRYARELGVEHLVEFAGAVPYDELPAVYGRASCLVLASLPTWFWEEQFGMVLAEAMAAGVPIVASRCGAIPEVVGDAAALFAPGDWRGLANALADGPLAAGATDPQRVARFSADAAAGRLRDAYDRVLAA